MHKTVKIVVSGDGGVGKTSFLNRLVHNHFNENNKLTRGVDFFSKVLLINGTEYNFILWDFAGQHQFKEIVNRFVDGSIAALILFDLSRLNTLDTVIDWINKLKTFGNIPIIILGTKLDLLDSESTGLIDEFINQITQRYDNVIDYMKISSKTGYNINKAFYKLINNIS